MTETARRTRILRLGDRRRDRGALLFESWYW